MMEKDKLTEVSEQTEYGKGADGTPSTSLPAGMLPLILLWLGTGLVLVRTFPSLTVPWLGISLAGIVLGFILLALTKTRIRRWVLPGGLVIAAVCCLLFHGTVLPGFESLVNDVLDRLSSVTGRIYLNYAGTENVIPALIVIILILTLLFAAAVYAGSLIPALPAVLAMTAGTAFGIVPVGAGFVLFALGLVLSAGSGSVRSWKVMGGRIAVSAVCAAAALAVCLPLAGRDFSGWRTAAARRFHVMRYDSSDNSLPEGQISDLGPWKKSDAAALEITMSEPQKLYLKGHIYEVYTGTAWESLPPEELAESEALFYWLHESGFYGQSQAARAMEAVGEGKKLELSVKNVSACSENAYLPYAFADTGKLDAAVIGDAKTAGKAQEAPGNGTRTSGDLTRMTLYAGSLPSWYEAQYLLCAAQEEPAAADYLALEESYRSYVTGHDLQLTQDSWNVLYRQIGEISGTHSLYEIQLRIRDFLEEHMHYDEKVYTLNGTGDFLHYVLESSDGGGWSVQYATAAVLMLRYFGVPARYVEGYYLPPEEAAKLAAGETVILTEKNAHAWAELYLNGVGFVPFEVTPGYIDPEDLNAGIAAEGSSNDLYEYEANQMTYARTEEPDIKEPEVGQKDRAGVLPAILLVVIIVLAALCVFVISRRLRLRRKLKEIDEADDRRAVAMRYGYACALKKRADNVTLPEDGEAALLNELALFSTREITGNDRARMDNYAGKVLKACRESWTAGQKLRLKWIEGIY